MEMSGDAQRWQGQKSGYSWEQDALDHIRQQMPQAEPYRGWQVFTFTAATGHVREVDLFIATPGGLFLVEIKSHPGKAVNNGSTWIFRDGGRTRTIDNPLHFTDLKAKELKGQLERAARQLSPRNPPHIPRVEAAVFLSAENLECRFDEFQRQRVYGRDGKTRQTGLPGIWAGFLNQPPASERNRVTPALSKQLGQLLHTVGIARLHKIGRIGPYELDQESFDAGPTWMDYLAGNPSLPTDARRRVRVFLTEQGAAEDERRSTQRAAHREYLALQGISHDGIVRAEQYSEELLAGPAVVFGHGADWQRLDHFIAAPGIELPLETRLEMIRQLAEALDHAHRRHLYHRALAARCVFVELDGRYPRLRIADWQVAARPDGTSTAASTSTQLAHGPASLLKHIERSAGAYLAPEFTSGDAAPVLLDVFGLGALSYLILTGQPPADSREQLAQQLAAKQALAPSAVLDAIDPLTDVLVREATALHQADRTSSVREFLRELDQIEAALTAPDELQGPETDPLTASRGDVINGYAVLRVLGKGSTSKAFLVTSDPADAGNRSAQRVFKVALNAAAARRLHREAGQLAQLTDSHVARLLDPPFEAGPPDARRTLVGVEYVGDHTLAEELRQHGPLTIHELERLGEDLFLACRFLEGRGVWHRDIKPDNLALREPDRKGRELVLFDFSLAGTPDTELAVGTGDYLDPFLGQGRRDRYDQAAELYAVAVTLHEMASGETPSWGDDLVSPVFLGPGEQVQLAEDIFDPVLRDGLVEFFRTALARDASQRFASLRQMTREWNKVFEDLETVPPLTTASTKDTSESATTDELRREAARTATEATPLAAAGLSPFALSIAQQRLGVSTAGELARVPARRITRLRGIGAVPRYELVRRSREWRQRFNLPEAGLARDDAGEDSRDQRPRDQAGGPERGLPALPAQAPDDLRRLPVDEVARRLIPDSPPELALVTGRTAAKDGRRAGPWSSQRDIAQVTGIPEQEAAAHLDRLRARWRKSVPALTTVREDLTEILREHGRVLGARQLAAALLARRGADLDDPEERLLAAAVCVRAAVETEERRDAPRLVSRRVSGRGAAVLVALTEAAEEDQAPAPRAADLFAYAELLGEQADGLSRRDPLPGVTEIRQALRGVDIEVEHAARLSDTDLVLLAASASANTAATARLELYPRDLSPERALKISQAGSIADGVSDAELAGRVLARFPDLNATVRPQSQDISRLLKNLGYDVTRGTDGLLRARSSTQLSASRGTARRSSGTAARLGLGAADYAWQRLAEASGRGGFVTLKASWQGSSAALAELVTVPGITPVNVTARFVEFLREAAAARPRLRWETVLAADSPDAPPKAQAGLAQLLSQVWQSLEEHVRAAGEGSIVLLHDATPLARYPGGSDLLAKLAVAARDAGESPRGLWLLCPMQDPRSPAPRLDGVTVGVIPGDAEQLVVPDDLGQQERRAS
ncbi:MAG TPA: BREX system serine/threonine kinase PglW [Trebonia sp.]